MGGTLVLIASVPGHCLSFTFSEHDGNFTHIPQFDSYSYCATVLLDFFSILTITVETVIKSRFKHINECVIRIAINGMRQAAC